MNLLKIKAGRIRRVLFWSKLAPDTPQTEALIVETIEKRHWRYWGYTNLFDCLMKEFELPQSEAERWTNAAIKKGDEDASNYGIQSE